MKKGIEFVHVILNKPDTEEAHFAGLQRYKFHVEHPTANTAAYQYGQDNGKLVDERTASLAACYCEKAVSKYYNKPWNTPYWKDEEHKRKSYLLPDVGDDIEVRWCRKIGAPVPVLAREAEHGYFLISAWVDLEHLEGDTVEVVLVGYVNASIAWENGVEYYGKRRCSSDFLNDLSQFEGGNHEKILDQVMG